jgi:hypothetical protein
VFSVERNKAAGLDGLPARFYQDCWDIVKNDLVSLFSYFFVGNLDFGRINFGIITLIPKKK